MTTLLLNSRNPFESPPSQAPRSKMMNMLPDAGASPKSARGDQSQVTSPTTNMGPPQNNSPEVELNGGMLGMKDQNGQGSISTGGSAQNSKVVQTAFIHKLYSMLEDQTIQHLISWSNSNDSFVMSPSNEFSKVLAQYFKHTNISSFVRQLNMYGFHKVSDVFHTGSPESALWEFRHGNGNFRKGDIMGLREIKRRASRHTLIHRDSFTAPKPGPSQPGTPQEIIPDTDQRVAQLEHMVYEMHSRLSRSEASFANINSRCLALTEGLTNCHQWMQGMSGVLQSLAPQDTALRSEMTNMQQDMVRQLDVIRSIEQSADTLTNGGGRNFFPSNMALDAPLSPRGYGFSDSRRSSIQMQEPPPFGGRPPVPPIPPQFSSSSRRFGSIGGPQSSPGFSRPPVPPQHQPHPLSNVVSPPLPNLARRHTSADIREHGWPLPNPSSSESPYASGQSSVHWQPSSPQQGAQVGDQQLRDQLESYEISSSRRSTITASNQDQIPAHVDIPPSGLGVDNVPWSIGPPKLLRPAHDMHSAPGTRRSSMASNVHSLLNPTTEMAERSSEEDGIGPFDDRKRRRVD